MVRPLAILIALATFVLGPFTLKCQEISGMFSRAATPVFDLYYDRHSESQSGIRVASPDQKKNVVVRYESDSEKMHLSLETQSKSREWDLGIGVGAEIGWSPDSNAFFLTKSPTSRNGIYGTTIYLLQGNSVKIVDLTPVVEKVFGHPVKCDVPESPNVAGIKWLTDSHRLLVAAEIVNHSICDSYGTFNLYLISVPDLRILGEYDQLKAKKLFWDDLGWELRPANDECIRRPKACEVPSHHAAKNE